MGKFRGFRMRKHLVGFTRWIFTRPGRTRGAYHRLDQPEPSSSSSSRPFSRLLAWGRRLTSKTRAICSPSSSRRHGSGFLPFREERPLPVPKGHLAVYLGQKDGDFRRVLVPVIYFNHPLFGELLREAEEEYGFNQQGGLTIPCGVSEFERVQMRIAAGHRMSRKGRC